MPVTATVAYPNEPDATFDFDYYKSKHMPLVQEKWAKYGLKSWSTTKFTEDAGSKPQFSIIATMVFDSFDQLLAAMNAPESKAIFDDVASYTNKAPVIWFGEVILSS